MKKLLTTLCAAALALTLCACAPRSTPSTVVPSTAPAVTADVTAPARETPGVPVLSAGAARDARLSDLMGDGPDGTLYTSLVRGDGVVCLYDLLPEDVGYIAGFLAAEDGLYAAVREFYYSLEPSALYRFPYGGGEGTLLADAVASGTFCLAGDSVFYESALDGSLMRLAGGQSVCVIPEQTRLMCACDGFIYYAKSGGIYRNDSTMSAETRLFDGESLTRLLADESGLYALSNADEGAVVTIREPNGAVRAERRLPEPADSLLLRAGRLYIPQGQSIAVLDTAEGEMLASLTLPDTGAYCLLWYAAPEAVYYEDYAGEGARLCRIGTDGQGALVLGERLIA